MGVFLRFSGVLKLGTFPLTLICVFEIVYTLQVKFGCRNQAFCLVAVTNKVGKTGSEGLCIYKY